MNSKLIKAINKINPVLISYELKPYLEKGHKNDTIYRTKDLKVLSKLSILIEHSKLLYDIYTKAGEIVTSTSLQNPTDKDATYRKKYGDNIGYAVNIQESFNDKNSVITGYDLKQNIHSDSKFADDVIANLASQNKELK